VHRDHHGHQLFFVAKNRHPFSLLRLHFHGIQALRSSVLFSQYGMPGVVSPRIPIFTP
jgi:hypothetical protein